MARGNRWIHYEPFASRCPQGATLHPSTLCGGEHRSDQTFVSLTQTLGSKAVNEVKAGYVCHLAPERLDTGEAADLESGAAIRRVARIDWRPARSLPTVPSGGLDSYATSYGVDLRNVGTGGSSRLRPDRSIVPRNNFVGAPIHRLDTRVQRRFVIRGHFGVDGILEVFNLFNHENYGAYTTTEVSPAYGKPNQTTNLPYQPRTPQLAFRFAF